jgi:hypothetical protein
MGLFTTDNESTHDNVIRGPLYQNLLPLPLLSDALEIQKSITCVLRHRPLKPTTRPIHDLHTLLSVLLILPLHQILHVGIRTIPRPTLHSHIHPMPKLIQIILHTPMLPLFLRIPNPGLARKDLIRCPIPHFDNLPLRITEHRLPHAIKRAVTARQRNTGRPHQIAERIRAVRDLPAVLDRASVPRCSDHDFCALVGTLPRHLGELPVVADDVRHEHSARTGKDGDAPITGVPWFDGDPGVHLSVVIHQLAFIIDDDAGVPRGRGEQRVLLHDAETAPDLMFSAFRLEGLDFGTVQRAHDGVGSGHAEAVEHVFGENYHVHGCVGIASFGDEGQDVFEGAGEVAGGGHGEELGLAEADDNGVGTFVEAAEAGS